ncbi:MAG: secretin N-terminal domain-containing protein [Candidatus Velthaea sp.]|jgi:type II secretory pathway component GspD/PulD (secretin)
MKRRALAFALGLALLLDAPSGAQPARLSIDARDTDLGDVIRLLAMQSGTNLVPDGSIKPLRVTLRLRDVSFDEALAAISQAYGLQAHRDGRIIIVGDAAVMNRRYPDDGQPSGSKTAVFALAHAQPDELKASLTEALPAGTVVVCDKRTGSVIVSGSATTIERARTLITALDAPSAGGGAATAFRAFHLRNVKASEAVKALKGTVPDNALVADDRQNVVVVTGDREVQASAGTLLASLDNPGKQVMFEVRVADLAPHIDSSNVGVQVGGAGYGSGALGQVPYLLTRSSLVINAQLNALVQTGHASILAQPRIATLNNKEATLLVGETYPVVTTNLQTGYPTVTNIDIGVKLRLTPTIGDDGSITAELHPEYSQIEGFNNAFPIVANRRVDSTLRVRDGETIVLGGLFSDIDSETVTKLPFLGDVPVLGSVFRNRQRSHTHDEVVFYITPHIL